MVRKGYVLVPWPVQPCKRFGVGEYKTDIVDVTEERWVMFPPVMSSRSVFWFYACKTLCRNPCSESMFVGFGGILMC